MTTFKKKLPDHLVGNELGQFKNELDNKSINNKIDKAYFLGIKQYGYIYEDLNNKIIDKSVIAGVKRYSISFSDIKKIFNGKTIEIITDKRFYKSLKNLKIKIETNVKTNVSFNPKKLLINNNYYPIYINDFNKIDSNLIYMKNLLKKMLNILNKTFKYFNK